MVSCEYIIVSVCCPSHTGGAGRVVDSYKLCQKL